MGGVILGISAAFGAATKGYSVWTSASAIVAYVMFGLAVACLACAAYDLPIPLPTRRRDAEHPSEVPAAEERPALPAAPVRIRFIVERDIVMEDLRLVALNRGGLGRFRAEVTSIRDQDGQLPVTARGGWPIRNPSIPGGCRTNTFISATACTPASAPR